MAAAHCVSGRALELCMLPCPDFNCVQIFFFFWGGGGWGLRLYKVLGLRDAEGLSGVC